MEESVFSSCLSRSKVGKKREEKRVSGSEAMWEFSCKKLHAYLRFWPSKRPGSGP